MENSLSQLYMDYEKSFQVFKSFLTTDYETDAYPPPMAECKTFGEEFPGSLIRKPQYKNCTFVKSQFNSSDGSLSRFHNCSFESCLFDNCDFRYCDILKSFFKSHYGNSIISSCNFSFGNFINSHYMNIHFTGCSFRQMQLEGTTFQDCIMQHCSIEQSTIKNCVFKNLNLRKVGVRYCTFEDTKFDNVIFHILDLARNYGLIQQLKSSKTPAYVAYKNDELMTLDNAILDLKKLIPYYLETGQFYEAINVYAAFNEYDNILNVLPVAFENVIISCDYAALQDLCSLIVKLNVFSEKQLREFYVIIKQLINPDKFPHYLRKNYNTYIENIKYILVDNPYENPEADIVLKTNITSLTDTDMSQLLIAVQENIDEIAPNIDTVIQLTHHSPYEILIKIVGALPEILMVCQIFYYCLGGTKSISDLKNSRNEKIKKTQPNVEKSVDKQTKRIELGIGKFFTFKYEKEYTKNVEALEYTIK